MSVRTYTHFIEPLSSDEVTVYGYFCDELAELATIDNLDDALNYVIDDVNETVWDDFDWRDIALLSGDHATKYFAEHRPQHKKLKVTTTVKVEVV